MSLLLLMIDFTRPNFVLNSSKATAKEVKNAPLPMASPNSEKSSACFTRPRFATVTREGLAWREINADSRMEKRRFERTNKLKITARPERSQYRREDRRTALREITISEVRRKDRPTTIRLKRLTSTSITAWISIKAASTSKCPLTCRFILLLTTAGLIILQIVPTCWILKFLNKLLKVFLHYLKDILTISFPIILITRLRLQDHFILRSLIMLKTVSVALILLPTICLVVLAILKVDCMLSGERMKRSEDHMGRFPRNCWSIDELILFIVHYLGLFWVVAGGLKDFGLRRFGVVELC